MMRKQSSAKDTTAKRKNPKNHEAKDEDVYLSECVEFLIRTRDNIDDPKATKPLPWGIVRALDASL